MAIGGIEDHCVCVLAYAILVTFQRAVTSKLAFIVGMYSWRKLFDIPDLASR